MGKMPGRKKGIRVDLRTCSQAERDEIKKFIEHVREYDLFSGWSMFADLHFCYLHDFSEYHPQLFSNLGTRAFSMRLQHFSKLKSEKRLFSGRTRDARGKVLQNCRTTHYFVPTLKEINKDDADSKRIAA